MNPVTHSTLTFGMESGVIYVLLALGWMGLMAMMLYSEKKDNCIDEEQKEGWISSIRSRACDIRDKELIATFMPLTRGETFGYLCALSGAAPMLKPYPSTNKEVNEKIIALLMLTGSKALQKQLKERFRGVSVYQYKTYERLLESACFHMEWFEEARYEFRNVHTA